MSDQPIGGFAEGLGVEVGNPPQPRHGDMTVLTTWCGQCKKPLPPYKADGELVTECPECHSYVEQREWPVSACENRLKAQFELWVQRRARRMIEAEGATEESDRMRSVYTSDWIGGKYAWCEDVLNAKPGTMPEGKHVRSALQSPPGFYHMMYLLLLRCDSHMTVKLSGEITDANATGALAAFQYALGNSRTPSSPAAEGAKTPQMTPAETQQMKRLVEKFQREVSETTAVAP